MKDLVSLLRSRGSRLCRDCGDDPCVCNDAAAWRETQRTRRLREETREAFRHFHVSQAAFIAKHLPEEGDLRAKGRG